MKVPTIRVKNGDSGSKIINMSDYDPRIHESVGDAPVYEIGGDLKDDGPTLAEYVAAGYKPSNYPPDGYKSKPFEEEEMLRLQIEWDEANKVTE